ncbi:hypothetical protein ACFMBG_06535, partial [Leisingera sp. D0M16]|uniref:hypothetical protein n=1 Tax=Leisingera coralii TaxID=3351347 RepID=UPI003B796E74
MAPLNHRFRGLPRRAATAPAESCGWRHQISEKQALPPAAGRAFGTAAPVGRGIARLAARD